MIVGRNLEKLKASNIQDCGNESLDPGLF